MIFAGICGAISSGKSTFAEALTAVDPGHSLHLETSTLVVELANTLNQTLSKHHDKLDKAVDLVPLANTLIESLLPQLGGMAGETIHIEQVAINPGDMVDHPDWYEKLFLYLKQAQQVPSIIEQKITADNKSNYRPLLQWIGGYFLYKLDNRLLWYEELFHRAERAGPHITLVALTAPRQPAEAEFIQHAGGKVLKIVRPGLQSDTTDVTERLVAAIQPDCIIKNNGSPKDLQKLAEKVRNDLLLNQLKAEYSAR